MMKYISTIICRLLCCLLPAMLPVAAWGDAIPVVDAYTSEGGLLNGQCWDIVQDSKGLVFAVRSNGLSYFDGRRWRMLSESRQCPHLRALFADETGRLYTGGFESFGFWEPDSTGVYHYNALTDFLSPEVYRNMTVWSIVRSGGYICFQTFEAVFLYDGETVKRIDKGSIISMYSVGDTAYVNIHKQGVYRLDGKTFHQVVSVGSLGGEDVTACAPLGNGDLLIGTRNGMFCFDGISCRRWGGRDVQDFAQGFVSQIMSVSDSMMVVGTRNYGIAVFDRNARMAYRIDKRDGLPDNMVLSLYEDADGNIWVGCDSGVAVVRHGSPFRFIGTETPIGAVCSLHFNGEMLYMGTNGGLYGMDMMSGAMSRLGTVGQILNISEHDEILLCGYNEGTVEITGMQLQQLNTINGGNGIAEVKSGDRKYLIQATYTGLLVYELDVAVGWKYVRTIEGFSNTIESIQQDNGGRLWLGHKERGLYCVETDADFYKVRSVREFVSLSGSRYEKIFVSKINGRVVFVNGRNFYTYDDLNRKIVPYARLDSTLGRYRNAHRILPVGGDACWLVCDNMFVFVRFFGEKAEIMEKIPFSMFRNRLEAGMETVCSIGEGRYAFGLRDGIVVYDRREAERTARNVGLMLESAVYINGGDTCRLALHPGRKCIELPFGRNNKIIFNAAFPYMGLRSYEIRYRLAGITEEWSGTESMEIAYERLPYGNYTLEIELLENGTIVNRLEYGFRIKPPFYASLPACVFYFLLTVAAVFAIRLLWKRRQRAVFQRMKKEQEELLKEEQKWRQMEMAETEKRRLESELLDKAKEVTDSAMMLLHKNEILQSLRDELNCQKEKLGNQYPTKYYNRMLKIIDDSMGHGGRDWDLFQANFDRVNEGFFKKLKETYPDLTQNDLRLCAYLRMNLSSKDIADLMNISLRGVEMARYRLRKRLGLSGENLVEQMIRL